MTRNLVLKAIKFYQTKISPTTPPKCRYLPTCSSYTYGAVEKFGTIKGLYLGFRRFLRCNPFHHGGYDPVPDAFYFFAHKYKKPVNEKK